MPHIPALKPRTVCSWFCGKHLAPPKQRGSCHPTMPMSPHRAYVHTVDTVLLPKEVPAPGDGGGAGSTAPSLLALLLAAVVGRATTWLLA